jgi:hypothetical protein
MAEASVTASARVSDALASLEDLKGYMKLTVNDDDALLVRLLDVASSWIRRYIDHDVWPIKSYTDTITGAGRGDAFWLVEWPVQSVVSLAYEDGRSIPERVGGRGDGWWLELPNLLHLHGYRLARGERAICTYTAGWPEVPFDLSQACIDVASYEYKRRSRIAQSSKNLPGENVAFDAEWASKYGRDVLDHWKRVVPKVGGLT